jgi:hypothetical protein
LDARHQESSLSNGKDQIDFQLAQQLNAANERLPSFTTNRRK